MQVIKKYTFNRSAFSKKIVLVIIAAVILIVVAIELFVLFIKSKPVFKMEPTDAEIRLFGIEPDASGIIFDPNGKKLYEGIVTGAQNVFQRSSPVVPMVNRTFIFEIPKISGQILNSDILIIEKTDDGNSVISMLNCDEMQYTDFNNKRLFFAPMRIPKEKTLYLFKNLFKKYIPLKKRIDTVDITFRYYNRQKRDAQFTYAGPFILGQNIELSSEPYCSITILKEKPGYYSDFQIQLTSVKNLGMFVYDKEGKRYSPKVTGYYSNVGSKYIKTGEYFKDISLDSIALITIGEKPKEIIYRNVPLYFSE